MQLTIGLHADGPVWPDTAAGGGPVLGHAIVGPRGLLDLLETALGLRRPLVGPVRRIATMRLKLLAAGEPRVWDRSLAADPWSTAELLLGWRDDLIASGWQPESRSSWPGRLADLAAAERSGPEMPLGHADRVAIVAQALERPRRLPWRSATVLDEFRHHPPGLGRLLERMVACGVTMENAVPPDMAGGDLGRVQRLLSGVPSPDPLTGDGSFTVLQAETEALAAEALAGWLAAGTPEENAATVCVLGVGTGPLDAALAQLHLPRFGHLPASPARAALQVLPLAFATRWAPFDPYRLLDLLQLPSGPIPRRVGRHLSRALAEAPGRGNPAWDAAVAAAIDGRRGLLAAEHEGAALTRALTADTARWREWIDGEVFDPETGMPAEEAQRLCALVAAWAMRDAEDPLRATVAGAATDLSAAIATTGDHLLTRRLLSRMVGEALGPGTADPLARAEAAPWSAVHEPGAVWGAADTVVWWAPGSIRHPRPDPWTQTERDALVEVGCAPASADELLPATAQAWRRPLLAAQRRFLMVVPRRVGGTACPEHPLMHELQPLLGTAPDGVRARAESVLAGPAHLAGRNLHRMPVAPAARRPVLRRWILPPGRVRAPEHASATTIEQMLGCRFAWTLAQPARLRRGARAEIPEGSRLLGLLAHGVVRDLFRPGPPPNPATVRQQAEKLLEKHIASAAATLLLPAAAIDLDRARSDVPRAVGALAQVVTEAGLTVLGTEVEQQPRSEASLGGLPLSGRIDLLLRDGAGREVVLDLKWSGTDRYRRQELEGRRAVQLATYARLREGTGGTVTAGYFLLAQARLLAADAWPFAAAQVGPGDLAATWRDVAVGWNENVKRLGEGQLEAAAVGEAEGDPLPGLVLEPPCRFCGYGRLCGVKVAV